MRRLLVILAAVLLLAGCGSSSHTSSSQQVRDPATGSRELSESDTGPVALAVNAITADCQTGAPASAYLAPAKAIVAAVHGNPNGVFESGNSAAAQKLRNVAKTLAPKLAACHAPAAARLLAGAGG